MDKASACSSLRTILRRRSCSAVTLRTSCRSWWSARVRASPSAWRSFCSPPATRSPERASPRSAAAVWSLRASVCLWLLAESRLPKSYIRFPPQMRTGLRCGNSEQYQCRRHATGPANVTPQRRGASNTLCPWGKEKSVPQKRSVAAARSWRIPFMSRSQSTPTGSSTSLRAFRHRCSGRRQRYQRRTTESYLALDIAVLGRRGLLQPGHSASQESAG